MNRIARFFGMGKPDFKRAIQKNRFLERALLGFLDGIGRFGIRMPQSSGAPLFVLLSVTERCNLRCEFCYSKQPPTEVGGFD